MTNRIRGAFTVRWKAQDGASQPQYTAEEFGWSSQTATAAITTAPSDVSVWSSDTPSQPSGKPYLWRRSRLMVYIASSKTYQASGSWRYVRLSGTNGTSVNVKGAVAQRSHLESSGYVTPEGGSRRLAAAGESYVCHEEGTYYGHLFLWSTEGTSQWLDLGVFQGANGVSKYVHLAWATSITVNSSGTATAASGFTIAKTDADSYPWQGICVDENVADPTSFSSYKWSYIKGPVGDTGKDGAIGILTPSVLSVDCDSDGVNISAVSQRISCQMNIGGTMVSPSGITVISKADYVEVGTYGSGTFALSIPQGYDNGYWAGVVRIGMSGQKDGKTYNSVATMTVVANTKGVDARMYEIIFEQAWGKIDNAGVITARIKGRVWQINGTERHAVAYASVRYGYIMSDSDTYVTEQCNAYGEFDSDSWFDGDEVDNYAKGSKQIFAAVVVGGSVVYAMSFTMVEAGADGENYLPNPRGIYDPTKTYSWGNGKRDFADYSPDNGATYYRYGVRSHGTVLENNPPETNGVVSSKWEKVHVIQTLITNCLFGTNAVIGGFQVSAQQMRSLSQTNGEPNILIDGNNGLFKANNVEVRGKVEATSGFFDGNLKARLFFSPVCFLGNGTYYIDPVNEPYMCFVGNGAYSSSDVWLPNAEDYPGLELQFFHAFPSTRVPGHDITLHYQHNDGGKIKCHRMEIVGNGADRLDYTVPCNWYVVPWSRMLTVKAIDRDWIVISGDYEDSPDYDYFGNS